MSDEIVYSSLKEPIMMIIAGLSILIFSLIPSLYLNDSYEKRVYFNEFEKTIKLHPNSEIYLRLPFEIEKFGGYNGDLVEISGDYVLKIKDEEEYIAFSKDSVKYIQGNTILYTHYFLSEELFVDISFDEEEKSLLIKT